MTHVLSSVAVARIAMMALLGSVMATPALAAPIGVPTATVGAGKTTLGGEVNILVDRDLAATGAGEAESLQAFAKGAIGVDSRLDLEFRMGLGDIAVDGTNLDSDIGPAFGGGFKVTWATIPEANLKIGSVLQTVHVRADDGDQRRSWTEYDAALGAVFDTGAGRDPRQARPQFVVLPYGGLAWSGADLSGGTAEDDGFGVFLGAAMETAGALSFGAELRLLDQIALSLFLAMGF